MCQLYSVTHPLTPTDFRICQELINARLNMYWNVKFQVESSDRASIKFGVVSIDDRGNVQKPARMKMSIRLKGNFRDKGFEGVLCTLKKSAHYWQYFKKTGSTRESPRGPKKFYGKCSKRDNCTENIARFYF